MRKKLFLSECKRTLPVVLTTFAVLTALAFLGERLANDAKGQMSADTKHDTDVLLSLILVGTGYVFGSRPFSSEFKDSHSPLLLTLPLRRLEVWAIIVSANLLVCVSALVLPFLFRPSMINEAPDSVLLYIILFAAGICFSLLFSRAYLNYIVGYSVTGVVLWMIYLYGNVPTLGLDISGTSDLNESFSVGGGLLFLVVLLFSCSAFFYVRGEFTLLGSRARNGLTLFCGVSLLLFGLEFSPGPLLFGFGEWKNEVATVLTSDGRRLAIIETSTRYPLHKKISIIDTANGKLSGAIILGGTSEVIQWAGWSGKSDILNLVTRDFDPLHVIGGFLSPIASIVRVSTDGRVLGKTRLSSASVGAVTPLPNGKLILVEADDLQGTIVSIDERSGALQRLAGAPLEPILKPGMYIKPLKGGAFLVGFPRRKGEFKIWMFDSQMHEMDWKKDWEKSNESIAKDHPFHEVGPGKTGTYLHPFYMEESVPFVLYLLADPSTLSGELYVFSARQQQWTLLTSSLRLQKEDIESLSAGVLHWPGSFVLVPGLHFPSVFIDARSFCVLVDSRNGLIVYRSQNDNQDTMHLYDALLDESFLIGKTDDFSARNFGRTLVGFSHELIYRAGSGILQKKDGRCRFLLAIDVQNNLVCESLESRKTVYTIRPDGTQQQLWPIATK